MWNPESPGQFVLKLLAGEPWVFTVWEKQDIPSEKVLLGWEQDGGLGEAVLCLLKPS